jgi:hypothetical protein
MFRSSNLSLKPELRWSSFRETAVFAGPFEAETILGRLWQDSFAEPVLGPRETRTGGRNNSFSKQASFIF